MSRWSHTSLFYAYTVLWRLQFTGALWVLYLLHLGWALWQVGLAEAAFHAFALASEVPTGAFADRFGYKTSLSVGLAIGSVATVGLYLLPRSGFIPGLMGGGATALSWSFTGGADRALLYRIAEESPEGAHAYARLYGRVLAITLAAGAVASAAGGLLVSLGWAWPFFLSALPLLLAIVPVSLLPAPAGVRDGGRASLTTLMRQGASAVRSRRALLLLVAFGALLGLLTTTNNLYAQATLTLKGAPVALVTLLIGAVNAVGAVGSLLAGRARRHAGSLLPLGAAAIAVGLVVLGVSPLLPAAFAFGLTALADGVVSPVYDAAMNDLAPPLVRATVLSFENALFSLSMIVFFPLFGWATGQAGTAIPYGVMGAAGVGLAFVGRAIGRAQRRQALGPGGDANRPCLPAGGR